MQICWLCWWKSLLSSPYCGIFLSSHTSGNFMGLDSLPSLLKVIKWFMCKGGFSKKVAEVVTLDLRRSTGCLYQGKCSRFLHWCHGRNRSPYKAAAPQYKCLCICRGSRSHRSLLLTLLRYTSNLQPPQVHLGVTDPLNKTTSAIGTLSFIGYLSDCKYFWANYLQIKGKINLITLFFLFLKNLCNNYCKIFNMIFGNYFLLMYYM